MTTLREKIEIMTAAEDGAVIQWKGMGEEIWISADLPEGIEVSFNWTDFDYRIKPAPMEIWVNIYSDYLGGPHFSKSEADNEFGGKNRVSCKRFIEVIE